MKNSLNKFNNLQVSNKYSTTSSIFKTKNIALIAGSAINAICPVITVKGFKNYPVTKTTETNMESLIIKSIGAQIKICVDKSMQSYVELPSELVKEHTSKFLFRLSSYSINAHYVNPSHNGGIIIEFNKGNIFSVVEIFNDEDVVFLTRNKDKRKVWDLNLSNFQDFVISELLD